MIAAVILAAPCTPDIAAYGPTPVLTWDALDPNTIEGYTVRWSYPGGTPQKLVDLPCYNWPEGAAHPERVCPISSGLGAPVPRYTSVELEEIDLCVEAYSRTGRSPSCSDPVRVCLPHVWKPGESYQ